MQQDIIAILVSLGVWNWFILGVALLTLEILAPGMFMLWLGIAALSVGVISFFVDWPWQLQIVAFAGFSLAAIPLWRRFAHKVNTATDQPFLNRRAEGLVGHVFSLEKPIVNGQGTLRVDDTVWRVSGPDLPAGARVTVAEVAGAGLRVEAASETARA